MNFGFTTDPLLDGSDWLGPFWYGEAALTDFVGGLFCVCESWQFTPGTFEQWVFAASAVTGSFTPVPDAQSQFTAGGGGISEFTAGCREQIGECDC